MLVVLEGLILCFWLLLICVIGIANGPVGWRLYWISDTGCYNVRDNAVDRQVIVNAYTKGIG
ncbi:MAG: hypothetical protein J5476_09220 [Lachnospiraceae bacterium]|nr:hypothetical protein [Lachnospiraceae bacterium]